MRVQCCICSDLFEDGSESNISAAPCGHTFHETCLLEWLDKSDTPTCPHCRVFVNRDRIISRLYFNAADAEEFADDDPSKLINEVHNLKLKLKQAEKEKSKAVQAKTEVKAQIRELLDSQEELSQILSQEQQTQSLLRKQVRQYEEKQKEMEAERRTFQAGQRRLQELEDIAILVNECESDANSIIDQYGERSSSQLATYAAILKREYETVKRDKRTLREELDGLRKVSSARGRNISALTTEVALLRKQIGRLEDELGTAESERDTLRQRLKIMRRAVLAPKDSGGSSVVEKLSAGSPSPKPRQRTSTAASASSCSPWEVSPDQPSTTPDVIVISPVKKARKRSLSPAESPHSHLAARPQRENYINIDDENFDLTIATKPKPSLSADPEDLSDSEKPSTSSWQWTSREDKSGLHISGKSASTNGATSLSKAAARFLSASSSSQAGQHRSAKEEDKDSFAALPEMNLFKKRKPGTDYSSTIRKGYDGMGGHELFTQPARQPLGRVVGKPRAGSSKGKDPPLPSLHGFLS